MDSYNSQFVEFAVYGFWIMITAFVSTLAGIIYMNREHPFIKPLFNLLTLIQKLVCIIRQSRGADINQV